MLGQLGMLPVTGSGPAGEMWRSSRQVSVGCSRLLPGNRHKARSVVHSRLQSTGTSGRGSAKTIIITAGVAAVGIGGTLAYAKVDSDFRRKLESSVPYGDSLIGSILGPCERPVRPLPAEVVKEKALESSLLRKKHPVEPSKGTLPPPPPIAAPPPTPMKEKTPSPRDLEAEAQKQLQDIKERNERLNFALEQSLREAQAELEKYTKDAVVAQLEAKEAAQGYARKLYRAIDEARDSEDQYMWDEALQAKEAKLAAVQKAAVKTEQAWKCLENLQSAIKKGQEDKETHSNLALSPAEHAAKVAREQLRNAESESRSAKEAARTASDYREAVERAQLHFQKEIEALLPETKFSEPGQKLSEDELNLLLAHAHRKIENLTKAHAKMQVTEQERAQLFQRQQERVARDLERQRAELDAMLEVKLVKQQEAFEHELQQQLRRQVAAHTEHLKEALEEQKEELSRTFTLELEKKMMEERAQHSAALSSSVAKLQGMEEYLRARDELDRLSQQAKSLWLACQGLRHTLVHGPAGGPQSLSTDVQLVERAAPMSPYVPLVLASIPEEALSRGVYPEVALKERFARVERACRRVALVDDKGPSSLLRYLASYLQSLCIIYPKDLPEEELTDDQRVNPEMWDTFDVLSRVRYWLQHENLERALRYASQLRGQPRLVAQDWIYELRLHLEARQAASALMAFAAATIAEDAE
uniref:MICOS complex subunit MIC60 n=1 Tax=Amblyomma parvum TaxID=251391 RepID=A0A023FVG5_AMBPA